MKITSVEHWTEDLELTRPYTIAYETISSVENQFVKIGTDDGAYGIGSASPSPEVTGETLEGCRISLNRHLEPLLAGQDISNFEEIRSELPRTLSDAPAACAAIDMALYDLMGKKIDRPLVDMLGRVRRSLPTSITIGILSIEESLAEAEEFLARGFYILKLKIGSNLEKDVACLRKLREKVGREVKIRVDANQGYSAAEFRRFMIETDPLSIEFVEQPLPAANIEGMRSMSENIRKQTAADESLRSEKEAITLSKPPQPFGIYNIKLMKCGGITSAMRIADVAEKGGINLMWGCNDESIVSITAALHAALASPATRYLDLDGSLDLARDVVKGGFVLENGEMRLTDKPGLGVELV